MNLEPKCPSCGSRLLSGMPGCDSHSGSLAATVHSDEGFDECPRGGGARGRFGSYELIEEIAQGGMGVVFKARQIGLDRIVALKMILAERLSSEKAVERFLIEARAAAKLQHPNIVAIHEVGSVDGQHFYSMDFVAGQTLAHMVREHPLPARQAAQHVRTISRAIHYAHQQGVLHRDLKPGNVMLDGNDEPRVTDFGLAKLLASDSQQQQTISGTVIGTPSYMSPEQAAGELDRVDARSDVYSLGAVLYELIAGSPPFRGETTLATLKLLTENEPVPPRQINPKIPVDLETICLKALEKLPARRYQDAQALAEDLRRFLDHEPIAARPVSLAGRIWRWCKRKPALAAVGSIAMLLLLTVAIGSPVAAFNLNHAKNLAQERQAAAEKSLAEARRSAYVADMASVQEAIERGQMAYALQLLRLHAPHPGQSDLRNWEWRYYWQVCQGDDLAALTKHNREIYFCSVSPSGNWVGTESAEGTVKLWNIAEHRETLSIEKLGAPGPEFSPDDRLFAVPLQGGTVRLWELASMKELAPIEHRSEIQAAGFSDDGTQFIAFAGESISYWDVATRTMSKEVRAIGGDFVAHSADWRTIAGWKKDVLRRGGELTLWREDAGVLWRKKPGHNDNGGQELRIALSPDGRWLALGIILDAHGSSVAQILDADSGGLIVSFPAERSAAAINGLGFSRDGSLFATACADQTIRLWNTKNWSPRPSLIGQRVSSLVFLPDGKRLVTAGPDGFVRLWSVEEGKGAAGRLPLAPKFCQEIGSERRGGVVGTSLLFGVTGDGSGVVVDPLKPAVLREFTVPFKDVHCAAAEPGASLLALGRERGLISLWNIAANQLAGELRLAEDNVHHLAISPDGKWLAGRSVKGASGFWNLGSKEELAAWRSIPPISAVLRFSPDGQLLACGQSDGAIALFEASSARLVATLRGHRSGIVRLGFAANGKRLATTSYDATARVWDLEKHVEIARFAGSTGIFFHPVLSPDGSRVFLSEWSVSSFFDVESQRCVARVATGYPKFLSENTVLGLGAEQLWHLHPPSLAEIDATEPGSLQTANLTRAMMLPRSAR